MRRIETFSMHFMDAKGARHCGRARIFLVRRCTQVYADAQDSSASSAQIRGHNTYLCPTDTLPNIESWQAQARPHMPLVEVAEDT